MGSGWCSSGAGLSEASGADGEGLDLAGAMFVARSIAADHKDLIHDVSFDFHGRRMATCSSDQSVKVRRGGRAREERSVLDPLFEWRGWRVVRRLVPLFRHAIGHEA